MLNFIMLIGKDVEYCIPEIERRVREALLQDDRITAVQNFEFTVNKKKVADYLHGSQHFW